MTEARGSLLEILIETTSHPPRMWTGLEALFRVPRGCEHDPFLSASQQTRGAAGTPQVEPAFDVILAWRTMYATDAHSHKYAPGDAAESLVCR